MARGPGSLRGAVFVALAPLVLAKDAFVFLGATGDNALRPSGVWQGVYEAFTSGVFEKVGGVDIHVAMNTPHTSEELHTKVLEAITPLHAELLKTQGWTCAAPRGDCSPARFMQDITVNIWPGRDADAQAANMSASLESAQRITLYLSIPPSVFRSWSKAAVDRWGRGEDRVHVAAEKPFGTGLRDADGLHGELLQAGVPEANLHLVDHWLSFFMDRSLPALRALVQPLLATGSWGREVVERVVVTEYETRGLDGRGGFFDGVGQVRDMVQSHLLQLMTLALVDPAARDLSAAKLEILNSTRLISCEQGQYDGFLLEPKLGYHAKFADATLSEVTLSVDTDSWRGVPVVIATGKDMGATLYTVEFFKRGGRGVLTFDVGKEETGVGGARVQGWPLLRSDAFPAPGPGFGGDVAAPVTMRPAVVNGTGTIANYSDPALYFPKPYALMAASLLTREYDAAFVTYPECHRSWEILTSTSTFRCLDPAPDTVRVYRPPAACGQQPPRVCWQTTTVQDLYVDTFACTPEHDTVYSNVSLYQAKCKGVVAQPEDRPLTESLFV